MEVGSQQRKHEADGKEGTRKRWASEFVCVGVCVCWGGAVELELVSYLLWGQDSEYK